MAMLEEETLKYITLVQRYQYIRQLPRVPEANYRYILDLAIGEKMLEKEACVIEKSSSGDGGRSRLLRRDYLELFLRFCLVMAAALLLLIPLRLLTLLELSRAESFGVIVGFTMLFGTAMMSLQDVDMHRILLGVCAFTAVLATVSAAQSARVLPQLP
ncbi:hypothetical protein B0T17DRAFT_612269 [Bombardia bombarda]|uniref:DUF6594 domain-containing protein n=1 Tax=Bombardia bombarda TaxID=252184 RepID=A0AA39XKP1_9PEZI|nr:hypothetical protein B0T17DRAFT_612269 [Bombardia bombarda]